MRAALDTLYRLSGWAAALLIVAICAIVTAQVALNALDKIAGAVGLPPMAMTIPSYSDFTGFFLAGASFLALAPTLRAGVHIRVGLLIDRLPPGPRRLVEILCLAAAAAATLFFGFYLAVLAEESLRFNDLSSGMIAVPLWIPQASMVAGAAILAIALLDDLVAVLTGRPPSYAGRGENLLGQTPDVTGEV